ncbi:MAG: hypothetical protein AB7T63_13945 [Planctomycetota bacterium]
MRLTAFLPVFLLVAACGGGGASPDLVPPPEQFVPEITHGWFPLAKGSHRTYLGTDDGVERREEEETLLDGRVLRRVACTGVYQEIYDAGELVETTTEWFAEDNRGNVWKFGEESFEVIAGTPFRTADSWLAGEDPVVPFIAFPASARVGDVYETHHVDGTDTFVVAATDAFVSTPAGDFPGCLELHENPEDLEDADIILYAPGLGRVAETSTGGHIELVAYTAGPPVPGP